MLSSEVVTDLQILFFSTSVLMGNDYYMKPAGIENLDVLGGLGIYFSCYLCEHKLKTVAFLQKTPLIGLVFMEQVYIEVWSFRDPLGTGPFAFGRLSVACSSSSLLSSRRELFEPSFLFQVILYQGGQIFGGAPQFYGRVGFAVTMPTTSASIFINNTQLSDTGTYQCLVNNLPDRGVRNIGVIGLTVLGVFIDIMGEREGKGARASPVCDSAS